jgi:hypothetical protein
MPTRKKKKGEITIIKKDPEKKKGRPPKYKKEFDDIARKLSGIGMPEEQIAQFLGVNQNTITRWKATKPDFCRSITEGKGEILETAFKALEKVIGGYVVTEKKMKVYTDEKGQPAIVKDGKGRVQRYANVVETQEKYIPANWQALLLFIRNRAGKDYRFFKADEPQAETDSDLESAKNELAQLFEDAKE